MMKWSGVYGAGNDSKAGVRGGLKERREEVQ
jgi:hypothetical protein